MSTDIAQVISDGAISVTHDGWGQRTALDQKTLLQSINAAATSSSLAYLEHLLEESKRIVDERWIANLSA